MNDPDMDPQEIVFHSLGTPAPPPNFLCPEVITIWLCRLVDDFFNGKGISEPQKNDKEEANSAEQVLQQLMKSNPELLIEFSRSFQNTNKE